MRYLFIIVIIIVIFSLCVYLFSNQSHCNEYFASIPDTHSNAIIDQNNKITNSEALKDCYSLGPRDCLKCGQCGIYEKNNIYKCVPGDVYGPLFFDDADNWIYGNSYDRYIYGEDIVRKYKPWNKDVKKNISDLLQLTY